jgi:hypothetical protein
MNENVITFEECRKRAQQGTFDAIQRLESSPLQLVTEDDAREVSMEPVECKWNNQPPPSKTKGKAYILAGLPVVLTSIYMVLGYGLHLW